MMNHGPVDVVVLAFGNPRFDGSALAELQRQSDSGTIRVLDMVVLLKDEDEQCWRVEISDLPPEQAAVVEFFKVETIGLFDDEDVAWLCEGMLPASAVVALAIENTWAIELANDVHAEGGELAFNSRVPAMIVDEAFATLS
jgi:hypothetical protein